MEGNFFTDIRQELMRELDQETEWSDMQILEKIDDLVLMRKMCIRDRLWNLLKNP